MRYTRCDLCGHDVGGVECRTTYEPPTTNRWRWVIKRVIKRLDVYPSRVDDVCGCCAVAIRDASLRARKDA